MPGTRTFTWYAPTRPGASPANGTLCVPAVDGYHGRRSGFGQRVALRRMTSRRLISHSPEARTKDLNRVSRIRRIRRIHQPVPGIQIAPCPPPLASIVKMAGANGARFTVCGALVWPFTVPTNDACVCPASSHGTCTFTCPPDAKNNGAAMPPNCSDNPEECWAAAEPALMRDGIQEEPPNTAAMLPGATDAA